MILAVSLDESGTHAGSPISVMEGYVGTAAQWKQVEEDWAALGAKGWSGTFTRSIYSGARSSSGGGNPKM